MIFFSLDYYRDYFNKYSGNGKNFDYYDRYFGYLSISPLIAFLCDNKIKSSYWDSLKNSNYAKKILKKLSSEDDYLRLNEYVVHGNNIEKYTEQYFRRKVKPILIADESLYDELLADYHSYHGRWIDKKYGYDSIVVDLSGLFLLNYLSEEDKMNLKGVIEDFITTEKICPICGNKFKSIFFPDWLYILMNGYNHICYECPRAIPKKSDVLFLIKKLVDYIGFIPNSGFQTFNNGSFPKRVIKEKWVGAFSIVLELGGSLRGEDLVIKYFKSWFRALVSAGVLDEGKIRTKRGIKCLARSGNECNSIGELYIDNYLFERQFKAIKEPKYPIHAVYNPRGLLRADWVVNDKYIEYFGLKGEYNYDLKTMYKIRLCKELKISLICIYPEDLNSLESLLFNL